MKQESTGQDPEAGRAERGRALLTERGPEFRRLQRGQWLAPSSHPGSPGYLVRLARDAGLCTCECQDWRFRLSPCKHVHACRVA